jgi:mono/diheme cytochrome c family protein
MWIAGVVVVLALGFLAIAFAAATTAPTFSKEVAPILFKNCANCHRPGDIASAVSLLSYDNARPWAKSIKEKVLQREMPPWPADPNGSVKFRNDPRLTQQDIDTLVAWVNAGAPKGNDADLPPMPSFAQDWLHPKGLAPDLVISLPQFQLPATGEIPYLKYLAKVPLSEDKWVVAIQVRPGNRALVHHMAITELALNDGVTPADLDRLTQVARQLGLPGSLDLTRSAVTVPANAALSDMLGVYTPGTTFEMYGDGSAKLLKGGKNFYLNFNIHYQTTGKPEKDRTMIAFWFQPGPPEHQLFRVPASGETIIADGKELLTDAPGEKAEGTRVAIPPIPPYAENYEVIGITAYTEPVTIYQFQPHAHLRGKDFKYAVVYPDGREDTVLNVPKYDFHWQLAYDLDTPLKLPAGSKLVVTAHYDNSLKNDRLLHHRSHDHRSHDANDPAHNPGPEKEVYFREQNQSWDEMFFPFIQYTIDSQDLTNPAKTAQLEHGHNENTNAGQQEERPDQSVLDIAEVVGCLEQSPSRTWILTNASDPIVSKTQETSSADLKAAAKPLGNQRYQLLGVSVFNPSSHKGEKVAVKGILIKDTKESRLNVTSLQMVAASCLQ